MTIIINVDGLIFNFHDDWHIGKYDDWLFYRNQFSRMWNGIKSIDILAKSPDGVAYFIEVKDYRRQSRTKPSCVSDEVCRKVFDTLAALLPARINANDSDERRLASKILKSKKIRVILHLEQPNKHSKLFPRAIDPVSVQQKLRRLLKPVDAHPVVTETSRMGMVEWTVG